MLGGQQGRSLQQLQDGEHQRQPSIGGGWLRGACAARAAARRLEQALRLFEEAMQCCGQVRSLRQRQNERD
jgi:hypothetical protein